MSFIESLVTIISGILAIIGMVYAFLKWGRPVLRRMLELILGQNPRLPRETLSFVVSLHSNMTWWHMGKMKGKPAMQVVAKIHVTNNTDSEMLLLRAYIHKPRTEGHVSVRSPYENIYGGYPILPHRTTDVSCDFFIYPPVREVGQSFTATVVIVDQYGKKHKIKNIYFKNN